MQAAGVEDAVSALLEAACDGGDLGVISKQLIIEATNWIEARS